MFMNKKRLPWQALSEAHRASLNKEYPGYVLEILLPNGTWSYIKRASGTRFGGLNIFQRRKLKANEDFNIVLGFPKPPAGEKWHNPEKLLPAVVELSRGWRLLLESEIGDKSQKHPLYDACQAHLSIELGFPIDGHCTERGRHRIYTYRTKRPLPQNGVYPNVS